MLTLILVGYLLGVFHRGFLLTAERDLLAVDGWVDEQQCTAKQIWLSAFVWPLEDIVLFDMWIQTKIVHSGER